MSKRSRSHKGQSSNTQSENYANTIHSWDFFDNDRANSCHTYLLNQTIDQGVVLDCAFMQENNFFDRFLESFQTDNFTVPQWERLFHLREPVYRELVYEFYATYTMGVGMCRNDVSANGIEFRLGGEKRKCSVVELGWRVGLYGHAESEENVFWHRLSNGMTTKLDMRCMDFWPTIGCKIFQFITHPRD